MPDNENGRPWQGGPMSSTAINDSTIVLPDDHLRAEMPRCRECGHVVFSRESIAAGIGRDCRRRLRAAARESVAT